MNVWLNIVDCCDGWCTVQRNVSKAINNHTVNQIYSLLEKMLLYLKFKKKKGKMIVNNCMLSKVPEKLINANKRLLPVSLQLSQLAPNKLRWGIGCSRPEVAAAEHRCNGSKDSWGPRCFEIRSTCPRCDSRCSRHNSASCWQSSPLCKKLHDSNEQIWIQVTRMTAPIENSSIQAYSM